MKLGGEKFKESSFKNLVDLKNLFEKENIKYWIECGLLLGLYREGDMINGDEDDVDISIPIEYVNQFTNNLSEIKKLGFSIRRINYSKKGIITAIALRRISRVDIHIIATKNNIVYFQMYKIKHTISKWGVYVYPSKLFNPLGEIDWNGEKFPCPNNIKEYLIVRYGKDWKINKMKTGEWTNCRDLKLNPCLQIWDSNKLGKLL